VAGAADLAPVADAPIPSRVVVERVAASDWKLALIRLIEALVWPVAFVAVALIFRVPLTALLTALARKLGA
jgi:hypothetical protein